MTTDRSRSIRSAAFVASLLAAVLVHGASASRPGAPSTAGAPAKFSPCQIRNLPGVAVYSAECTHFEVAENPAEPEGRRIRLHVARVPAINRRKEPDPLFLFAGGPGMGATTLYGNAAQAFARIHRNRDIVLIDQRGTGSSNPLDCALDELSMLSETEQQLVTETKRCLQELSKRADVAYYTTSVAVQDVEHVRAALGYERINLYGGSYGTRVAGHYMRRYPQRTRAVILDGVVDPGEPLGPDIAIDAENALQSVLSRCASSAACREAFGDPRQTYRALRAALNEKPVSVSFTDPTTGEPKQMELGALHLALVLRLSTYSAEQAALLPLTIDLAQNKRNFAPLAGQFLLTMRNYSGVLAFGMHNTVVCSEDVPFYETGEIDRERLRSTFMGTASVDSLIGVCELWPRGPVDADMHAPFDSDVPVLLLSGGNDPVTPPANADRAMEGLSNSMHLVLPDLGHGQIAAPCMDRVMAEFIRTASVRGLDTSCTERAKPMPFFTSLAGPAP